MVCEWWRRHRTETILTISETEQRAAAYTHLQLVYGLYVFVCIGWMDDWINEWRQTETDRYRDRDRQRQIETDR